MKPAGANAAQPRSSASPGLKVVVRAGAGLGFRLGGFPVEEIPPGEETSRFKALLTDSKTNILAIEEEVYLAVPAHLLRRAAERGLPIILPFALPERWTEAPRGREYIAALIRRAIGYHIRVSPEG